VDGRVEPEKEEDDTIVSKAESIGKDETIKMITMMISKDF
jgi:hypothetical protein